MDPANAVAIAMGWPGVELAGATPVTITAV
jgi:hypothetical protein